MSSRLSTIIEEISGAVESISIDSFAYPEVKFHRVQGKWDSVSEQAIRAERAFTVGIESGKKNQDYVMQKEAQGEVQLSLILCQVTGSSTLEREKVIAHDIEKIALTVEHQKNVPSASLTKVVGFVVNRNIPNYIYITFYIRVLYSLSSDIV